ncbi:MAG: tripartite tricarboxylate transporter substrate binding protein [Betaproteobacteria bacterium]|nr:MAG: tripartite tricarboxylate transporter substrate binding protein [Betaproteobacteria bacterium]
MFKNVLKAGVAAVTLSLGLVAAAPALALDSMKILVPANPGGGWDQTARALQAAMQADGIVRKVSVDNRGGAGGTIGLSQFVNGAKGDGSATLMGGMVMVGAIVSNKSPVNLTQVTPLARLTGESLVVVVPASSKVQTLKELIEQLKANPGSVSFGGGSFGGSDHILAGLIAKAVGVDPSKVNYIAYSGGGEAQAAIMGGHVAAGISGYGEFQAQIKSGKLRALGVSSAERIAGEPVPTLKEQGVDVELINWRALFGAPGITEAQRQELIAALDKAVVTTSWKEALKRNDWADVYLRGDEFAKFLEADSARVSKLVTELGIGKK